MEMELGKFIVKIFDMLIDGVNKVIILHIPKTGGRFRRSYVSSKTNFVLMKNWHITYDSINSKNVYIRNVVMRPRVKVVGDTCTYLNPIDQDFDIKNYTVYAMVRNPYDRFVSAIKFKNFGDRKRISNEDLNNLINSELDKIEKDPNYIQFGGGDHSDRFQIVMVPQSYWLGDSVKLLKYENIGDWKTICDILGTPIDKVHIKNSYNLTEEQKRRIKKAYYEFDKKVFDFYGL